MIELNNITLILVGFNKNDEAIKALRLSSKDIKFGKIKLFTFDGVQNQQKLIDYDIEHVPIRPLDYWEAARFLIFELNAFIDTEFCLSIHTDGFVLNPNLWNNEFFNYDYIGAPWFSEGDHRYGKMVSPQASAKENWNKVGNSGFCLRSKKILEVCANSKFPCDVPDDVYICRNYEDYFLSNGIKFSPESIASKFSQDPLINIHSTFGFHGNRQYIHTLNEA